MRTIFRTNPPKGRFTSHLQQHYFGPKTLQRNFVGTNILLQYLHSIDLCLQFLNILLLILLNDYPANIFCQQRPRNHKYQCYYELHLRYIVPAIVANWKISKNHFRRCYQLHTNIYVAAAFSLPNPVLLAVLRSLSIIYRGGHYF